MGVCSPLLVILWCIMLPMRTLCFLLLLTVFTALCFASLNMKTKNKPVHTTIRGPFVLHLIHICCLQFSCFGIQLLPLIVFFPKSLNALCVLGDCYINNNRYFYIAQFARITKDVEDQETTYSGHAFDAFPSWTQAEQHDGRCRPGVLIICCGSSRWKWPQV